MDNLFKRYEELRNDIHIKVLEYLLELGTEKYIFDEEVYYHKDYSNSKKSIKISYVEFNNNSFFDGSCLDHVIKLGLSNSKSIYLSDLKFDSFTIYFLLNALRCAVIEKDKKSVFDCKLQVNGKDIIITDPCYIIKEKPKKKTTYINYRDYDLIKKNGWDVKNLTISQVLESFKSYREFDKLSSELRESWEKDDDWRKCHHGDRMDLLGINNYLISDTIYGDWSCTTFNTDTKESIGNFCADAGMVGVFLLDEVLKYNPDYDDHINKTWTTTLIKNFTGEIWIEKRHNTGIYESTTEYHKKGDTWENDSIHVLGSGNINFITMQSGY